MSHATKLIGVSRDFPGAAALNEWLIFVAIKYLAGRRKVDTIAEIAERLGLHTTSGPHKGEPLIAYIQSRVRLGRLPEFVQREYYLLVCHGRDATTVRWPDVHHLYSALNTEYIEHGEGDGPEFQALWQAILRRRDD